MDIEARISKAYRRKLAFIGLILLAFGAWAGYDVLVVYPPQFTQYTAWQEHMEDWPSYAQSQGWPEVEPRRRVRSDFYFNGALMLFIPIGLYFLANAVLASRRWVRADEQGIRTYRARQVAWDGIESLNNRRWISKGIAVVIYRDIDGRRRRIVLDEFNFEAKPIRQIHARVQEVLGMTNDIPDPQGVEKVPPEQV
jgi:hypothetical protein